MSHTPQEPSKFRAWLYACLDRGYRALRIYVVFALLMYIFQDQLFYRPITATEASADSVAAQLKLTTYTGAADWKNIAYTPLSTPTAAASTRGTVIVAHGNARTALDCYVVSDALTRLGFRVILYEYPGYGACPGTPTEESIVTPLRKLVREVAALGESRIYLFGQSMGCGVVCSALGDKTLPVAGAILLQPWDKLGKLADHHLFIFPCSYMLGEKYNSVANLAHFTGPVVFAICEKDTTIPPVFSQRLFDSYTHRKLWYLLPGCDHNDWPAEPDAAWWKAVSDFVAPPTGTGTAQPDHSSPTASTTAAAARL
ncbi:MAG: alpha/beta hydrolase [Candidatus Methylacidiphilales bacterium]|nr:alpha/beta fold hydrolase [Candidatus Methylacidiphilales bacterium]